MAIDSEGTLKPVCPYCGFDGFEKYHTWTYEGAKECPDCGMYFEYRTDVVYSTYSRLSGGKNPDLGICATCQKYDTCNQKTDIMIGCNMYVQTKKIEKRAPKDREEETKRYIEDISNLYDTILKDVEEAKLMAGCLEPKITVWTDPIDPHHNV